MPVSNLSDVRGVSGGGYHSLAVKSDGSVRSWGNNWYGQLGNGTTTSSSTPVTVLTVSGPWDIIYVSAGLYHSLAVASDGTVWVWGLNGYGQLGDGTTQTRLSGHQVTGFTGGIGNGGATGGKVIRAAAGGNHSLALRLDGTVWSAGANGSGQLGDGTTTDRTTPVQVSVPSGVTITAVAAGGNHSLALDKNGTLYAWGNNWSGQVGDGTTINRTSPVQVLSDVVAVAAGYDHSLAVRRDGTVWAWGNNGSGRLGDGTAVSKSSPVEVLNLDHGARISGGTHHTLGVSAFIDYDFRAYAWGSNFHGQLGTGGTTDSWQPVQVSNFEF